MKFHPDKNNGEKFYEDQFRAILEAWDVLSNPAKKAAYDQQLRQYKAGAADAAYKDALIRKYEAEIRNYKAAATQQTPPVRTSKSPENKVPLPAILFVVLIMLVVLTALIYRGDAATETISPITGPVVNTSAENPPLPVNTALLMDNNRSVLLQDYLADKSHIRSQYRMVDPDHNDTAELQVTYHTGGAPCCNVDHLFARNASGQLQLVFSYLGGMYIADNQLSLYFYQDLGYYHSCYTCSISGQLPSQYVNAEIILRFDHGRILPAPVNEKLNAAVNENLRYLFRRGIPDLDAEGMDNGSRKEIMVHMLAWHFNNHDNAKTKELFEKYYTWKDSTDRWNDLQAMIRRYEEIIFANAAYRKKQAF